MVLAIGCFILGGLLLCVTKNWARSATGNRRLDEVALRLVVTWSSNGGKAIAYPSKLRRFCPVFSSVRVA